METIIYIEDLPRACIADCGIGSGAKDDAVAHWIERPEIRAIFDKLDRGAMRVCLRGYGAWEDDELQDDATNERRILWLACSDFGEYIVQCDDAGIDPFAERPIDFEPNSGSDIFCLE
jgi:hypothetical protein